MRVVFIGASAFGRRCLAQILKLECCRVIGVVTAPRTFSISYRPSGVTNVLYGDIEGYCKENGIDCVVMTHSMKDPALVAQVEAWKPDLFVVVGWYHMVPKSWRALAPAYGLHASLLPDYSGGAPLVWAIINGEKKTGITFFQFSDGVDNGPIVGQLATTILADDTIASLYSRIESLGLQLLKDYLPRLVDGSAILALQDESKRRVFPQRGPEDGKIVWGLPAHCIRDFIRAQTRPYPGAFTFCGHQEVKIWMAREVDWTSNHYEQLQAPGSVVVHDAVSTGLAVVCGDGKVLGLEDIEQTSYHASGIDICTTIREELNSGGQPRLG